MADHYLENDLQVAENAPQPMAPSRSEAGSADGTLSRDPGAVRSWKGVPAKVEEWHGEALEEIEADQLEFRLLVTLE
jgi:hypothetical protein